MYGKSLATSSPQVSRGKLFHGFAAAIAASMLMCISADAQDTPSPYEIRLPSRTFVPQEDSIGDLAEKLKPLLEDDGERIRDRVHVLVQLESPPETSDRQRLGKDGVSLLSSLNKRTWHASVNKAAAEKLGEIKGIRWAGLLEPEDKLVKSLQGDAKPLPYQLRDNNRLAYSVLFHGDVKPEEVVELSNRIEVALEGFDARSFPVVRVVTIVAAREQLQRLGGEDIVARIEPPPAPVEDENVATAQPLSNVDNVQAAPYGLDGTGVTVGVWEAGDVIDTTPLDLAGRVIVQAGQVAGSDDHAAHVAGTIGASGANVLLAEGMAPNVTIASWDANGDTAEMVNAATSAGNPGQPTPIQISNHSYGSGIGWNNPGTVLTNNQNQFGLYNAAQSQAYDNVVFQTGLTVVKSAGNHRNDAPAVPVPGQPADGFQGGFGVAADCIGPGGVGKNIITVGAMNGAGAITTFSSFGPTDDGRIKPDLMAEGNAMLSLACNCFDDRDGDGIDDVPNTTTATRVMGGTSMSSPVVTGIAALLLQEANNRSITVTPSAIKALLVQTARDVQGTGQATIGPDYATGWGIADAEAAVDLLRQGGITQGTLNATGLASAWTQSLYVPPGEGEIHVTLAWDDPAGTPGGQILINDLDLRLIAPDTTVFTPWTLNPANPGAAAVRNGGNDAVNNVEQVSVVAPMSGVWTVRVSAGAGNLPQAPQVFSVAGALQRGDVMLVMDRSGSMSLSSGTPGVSKLEALQSAANEFIDLLDIGGGHRLGLVQFEENLVPLVPPIDLDGTYTMVDAHNAINSMTSGGWTNIIAGVNEADSQLSGVIPPLPQQTIVVSDGKHNRPIGSDLADINATVVAGGYRFHSIGFGTDVDGAILTNVANNSGGVHLNEQDLSPIELTKHFLTVGALIHDMTVLVDPLFKVGSGKSASLPVQVSKLDQSVTFAVNWSGVFAKDVELTLDTPDRRCLVPLKNHRGVQVRAGDYYRLVRVELPYICSSGATVHDGQWRLRVKPKIDQDGEESIDITALAESQLKLVAKAGFSQDGDRVLVTGAFLRNGKVLRRVEKPVNVAHIVDPLPLSRDSEKLDGPDGAGRPPSGVPKKQRTRVVRLLDTGKGGDMKAGDGVFTTALRLGDLKPGLLQIRLVSSMTLGKQTVTREARTTVYVKKR